jgi:hypothetical protein
MAKSKIGIIVSAAWDDLPTYLAQRLWELVSSAVIEVRLFIDPRPSSESMVRKNASLLAFLEHRIDLKREHLWPRH